MSAVLYPAGAVDVEHAEQVGEHLRGSARLGREAVSGKRLAQRRVLLAVVQQVVVTDGAERLQQVDHVVRRQARLHLAATHR